MERGATTPIKLHEEVAKCPACGNQEMKLEVYIYEIPVVGKIILAVGTCSRCGYRFRDVRLAEQKQPRILKLRVEKPDDLNILVVRAPSATVRIEELLEEGPLEMKPGPIADGFITTVEGVLHRFKEIVEFACQEPDADKTMCEKVMRRLNEAIDGKRVFTLMIIDPEGVSAIASDKVEEEPLKTS